MIASHRQYRILHCSTALSAGGEVTLLRRTLQHLDAQRFSSIVCQVRSSGGQNGYFTSLGAPVVCLDVRSRYNLAGAVNGLRNVINEQEIDMVHMGLFGTELHGFLAAMATGRPMLATLTTMFDPQLQSVGSPQVTLWKLRIAHLLQAMLACTSRAWFLALSHAVKESAVRHLRVSPERTEVISLGLVPEEFESPHVPVDSIEAVRRELGLNEAYPVLLNVARLSPAKGQEDLLRAMPFVLERFPQAKLLIAGEGPRRPQLEQLRDRMGLGNSVLLLGQRNDVPALLLASDVFLFSSHYEGLPHAVLEAMAAGMPVAAFQIPALVEVVEEGQTGFLADSRDPRALAQLAIRIVGEPGVARAMGNRARQVIRARFDIRRNIKQLEALYERIVAERCPTPAVAL